MSIEKPKDKQSYYNWLKLEHGVDVDQRLRRQYDAVLSKAIDDINGSAFWKSLMDDWSKIGQAYFLKTNYHLYVSDERPNLVRKPFDSLIDKSYRKNIIDNSNWPEPPGIGWVLPDTWYGQINDLIRTCFVVKYLDGVEYLVRELETRSNYAGFACKADYEARDEGYYAAHFCFNCQCDIPDKDWNSKLEMFTVELQVTTQLQEVIRKMLHKYYEGQRSSLKNVDVKWQWDYKSNEFSANYLGHILHYVEGMIMDVRDK